MVIDRFNIETASYVEPLVQFTNQYGLMVVGAFLLLTSFQGRRFGPFALVPLVIGLGLVMSGAAHLVAPLMGR